MRCLACCIGVAMCFCAEGPLPRMPVPAPSASTVPTDWEHFCTGVAPGEDASLLAEASQRGWELVSRAGGTYCFKRPADGGQRPLGGDANDAAHRGRRDDSLRPVAMTERAMAAHLRHLDGVLDANLVITTEVGGRSGRPPEAPSASVIIKYCARSGHRKPPSEAIIEQIVATGIAGLAAERVVVVMSPVTDRSRCPE